MQRFLFCLAFAIGLSITFPTQVNAVCPDVEKSFGCQNGFDETFVIPNNLTSSEEFMKFFGNYYLNIGSDGLADLCSSVKALQECEGDQFKNCTSMEAWVDMGLNETDAYVYAQLTGELLYQCGSGYDVWNANLECVGGLYINDNYTATVTECEQVFMDAYSADETNICEHMQDFVVCQTPMMSETCGNTMAYTYCNGTISGMIYAVNLCDALNCDFLK